MKVLVEKTELVSQLQKIMESFHLIAKERELISTQTNTEIYAWVDCDKFEKDILQSTFKCLQIYTEREESNGKYDNRFGVSHHLLYLMKALALLPKSK